MEYLISNLDSLDKLRQEKDLKHSIRKIRLEVANLEQTVSFEKRLNRYYFACGCKEGAIGVYLSLLGCLLFWWSAGFSPITAWWKIIPILAASALMGKLSGLLLSKIKLNKTLNEIERNLQTNQPAGAH